MSVIKIPTPCKLKLLFGDPREPVESHEEAWVDAVCVDERQQFGRTHYLVRLADGENPVWVKDDRVVFASADVSGAAEPAQG